MTETRPYHNEATQSEKREVLRDSYLTRAQADAELGAQGRFKRETTTRITSVPVYPKQPANSPWSQSTDEVVGVEPSLGVDDLGGSMAPDDVPPLASDVETSPPKPNEGQE